MDVSQGTHMLPECTHTDPEGGPDMGTQAAPRKRNTVDT